MTPLLAVRDFTVRYASATGPLTAVSNVSFDLASGEALGLVGESGSGKSTIAGAILDLLGDSATIEGEIFFEGLICAGSIKAPPQALGRRTAPSSRTLTTLDPAMTVGRHIMEPLSSISG